MVYIFCSIMYPLKSAEAAVRWYFGVMQQYPNLEELGSEVITAVTRSTPDGMNVVAMWQPAPG